MTSRMLWKARYGLLTIRHWSKQPRFGLANGPKTLKNFSMAFLTKDDLVSHIKAEVIDFITESDDTVVGEAIAAAIEEAKGYLSDYDIDTIFTATGTDRNPIVLLYTKDIAVWHFINLANPNIEISFRETRYNLAIEWLEKVQSRKTNPAIPLRPSLPDGSPFQWDMVRAGSNTARRGSY